ncbi:MAG: hypothetical protein ABIJ09_13380 [Pseudomonadota bacterium]
MVVLFSTSALYHDSTEPRRKHRLLVFNHVFISLLIAWAVAGALACSLGTIFLPDL